MFSAISNVLDGYYSSDEDESKKLSKLPLPELAAKSSAKSVLAVKPASIANAQAKTATDSATIMWNMAAENPFVEASRHFVAVAAKHSQPQTLGGGLADGWKDIQQKAPQIAAKLLIEVLTESANKKGQGKSYLEATIATGLVAAKSPVGTMVNSFFLGFKKDKKDLAKKSRDIIDELQRGSANRLKLHSEAMQEKISSQLDDYKKQIDNLRNNSSGENPDDKSKEILGQAFVVHVAWTGAPARFYNYELNFSKSKFLEAKAKHENYPDFLEDSKNTLRFSSQVPLDSANEMRAQLLVFGPTGTGKNTIIDDLVGSFDNTAAKEDEKAVGNLRAPALKAVIIDFSYLEFSDLNPNYISYGKDELQEVSSFVKASSKIDLAFRQQDYINPPVVLNDIIYEGKDDWQNAYKIKILQGVLDRGVSASFDGQVGDFRTDTKSIHRFMITNDIDNIAENKALAPFIKRTDLYEMDKLTPELSRSVTQNTIKKVFSAARAGSEKSTSTKSFLHEMKNADEDLSVTEARCNEVEKLLEPHITLITEKNSGKDARSTGGVTRDICRALYLAVKDDELNGKSITQMTPDEKNDAVSSIINAKYGWREKMSLRLSKDKALKAPKPPVEDSESDSEDEKPKTISKLSVDDNISSLYTSFTNVYSEHDTLTEAQNRKLANFSKLVLGSMSQTSELKINDSIEN